MLMSYVQRPSLKDSLVVSKALHGKFKFLGDESSEVNYILFAILIEPAVHQPPPPLLSGTLLFVMCVECLEVVYIHTSSECEQAYS